MWYKKQTAVDGFRWDAVKHFPAYVQEDYSYNLKSVLPSWCKGGQNMFNVGEWVGSKNELDNYVNTIAAPTGDKMMGTFDFGLRAFDNSGGLYGMVYGMGNFNMATLPAAQQNERVTYYPATNTYVHRTVPFVNNHDTFRPQVSSTGNYIGWNSSGELSPHIEPNEPRLSAAYAVILAMDGNPQIFFEDLFDIGYNGNRYNHDPKSNASLPMRSDLQNLMWCHQALDFKSGPYQVPHASDDYLVIARAGKAIIGITDSWSTWQNQWVYTSFPAGTVLKDYSGANASTTVTVDGNGWAQISTPPVNPTLNIAGRRGYSVWAPVGLDANTYSPSRAITTTQEWEMAGDLGDRHASSLGQGGAIPGSSTNFRIVGKIFVESGKPLTYVLYPQNATKSLFLGVYNNAGTQLASVSGLGTLTGNYTPNFTGWITFKVRNSVSSNPTQKCWVNVTYTAPAVVTNAYAFPSNNTAAFWSGNGNDSNWYNENNWEEGKIPDASTDVIIPGNAFPQPAITDDANIAALILEEGSHIYLSGELSATEMSGNGVISGTGSLVVGGQNMSLSNSDNSSFKVFPNPFYDQLNVIAEGAFDATSVIRAELFSSDGRLISESSGTLSHINSMLNETLVPLQTGIYFLRVTGASSQFLRLVKE
jgi:alpha-amylase